MAGIWIYAEYLEQARELLTIGRTLASAMNIPISVFMGHEDPQAAEIIELGADEVLVLPPLPPELAPESYIPLIATEAKQADPDIILLPADTRGWDMAPRIAARLEAGLCTNCTDIRYEGGRVVMERSAYGGAAIQTVTFTSRPAMATVPPRQYPPAAAIGPRRGRIRELPPPPPSPVRIVKRHEITKEVQDITEAKVIVAAGRGVEKKEDLVLVRDLARALGGEMAATRPLTEELHWLPAELCIGLSGVSVRPDLYMAVGVSGQVQHMTGVRNAKVIGAINRDENAPIFGLADLGIVGDLYEVVPKLINALKR